MALDQSPGVVQTLTRQQVHDNWTRDYALRVPDADVGPGTQPDVDASVAADAIAPLYADAVTIGRGTTLRTSAGSALTTIGEDEGIDRRPAVGAEGFVGITTSSGGSNILAGTVITSKVSQLRFQVLTTALYTTSTPLPIVGIDTGPQTNLAVGTAMQFQAPPPGCAQDCTVIADSNGNGLTGGRDADDDQTYRSLISDKRANPPASGNDAEYQATIRSTPGLSIQQVFTYPAILGSGTKGYCFTLNPATPGGSRVPNSAQIAQTLSYVLGEMPADDGVFACTLSEVGVRVCLRVTWAKGAANWTDVTQFPQYLTNDPVVVAANPAPTLTSFTLTTGTATTDPQAGQTIGFYDPTTGLFKKIRIKTVGVNVSGKQWSITVDSSYGVSDAYVPVAGQPASPWSDSLQYIATSVLAYFGTLGPGEQVSPLPDPGLRQQRQPVSPSKWPSIIDNRILFQFYSLTPGSPINSTAPLLQSPPILLEPTQPYSTPVGTPGVLSYILKLANLAAYP